MSWFYSSCSVVGVLMVCNLGSVFGEVGDVEDSNIR